MGEEDEDQRATYNPHHYGQWAAYTQAYQQNGARLLPFHCHFTGKCGAGSLTRPRIDAGHLADSDMEEAEDNEDEDEDDSDDEYEPPYSVSRHAHADGEGEDEDEECEEDMASQSEAGCGCGGGEGEEAAATEAEAAGTVEGAGSRLASLFGLRTRK